jgi:hypothetical protein
MYFCFRRFECLQTLWVKLWCLGIDSLSYCVEFIERIWASCGDLIDIGYASCLHWAYYFITSSSLEANNGMNGISLWNHVIVRKFAQRPGFQPVFSGYLSLIITPSSSNLKFWDKGKKSELKNLQFWLFQNLKEPAVFITSKEQWVSGRFSQYLSWFWEWWLCIYQNQFSEFLRTVIMRPKNDLNNHQGFDAISGTLTTPVTRHQEIPIYFSHES